MKTSIIKSKNSLPPDKYPRYFIHSGESRHGDPDWKDTVVLALSDNEAIIVHLPESNKDFPLLKTLNTFDFRDDKVWTHFYGELKINI